MQPPRLKPDIERAIDPAIPAIIREIRMSIILTYILLNKDQRKLNFIELRINYIFVRNETGIF
jgi:hypothetical protein